MQDVLLNPETLEVFTPNTGQTKNLKTGEVRADDMELRFNPNHDDRGRFTSGGGGGGGRIASMTKLFSNGGAKPKKSVDKSGKNGVEYGKGEIKNDFNGKPYTYPELHLSKKEYGTVIRQIDDYYESKYKGKSLGFHSTSKYTYKFEIRGYNDYNIFSRWKND